MADVGRHHRIAQFHEMIADMDLPEQKKTAHCRSDLMWLTRNMGIRNSGHPNFDAAMTCLKSILRECPNDMTTRILSS